MNLDEICTAERSTENGINSFNQKDYTVRRATVNDILEITNLYRNSFQEHIMVQRGILTSEEYFQNQLKNLDEIWTVVEKENKVVGVAALAIIRPVGLGEIERVCVDRNERGCGYAVALCEYLVNEAKNQDLGFIEAFARGDQPAMQRTFEKLGFKTYGVAPRFEVVHNGRIVREQFVHMGLELKPETVDEKSMVLIPTAKKLYNQINSV